VDRECRAHGALQSSSWAVGAPNSARTPSPVSCATVPPKRSTSSRISRTTSSKRNFDRSGPSLSAIGVESATSATRTDTIRRSPAVTDIHELYADGSALTVKP